MSFGPGAFQGTAEYYLGGRPPYSAELAETLARELSLDGGGRLLDIGCGPGVLELRLAHLFADVVALDPEPEMLRVASESCAGAGIDNVRWIEAVAEEIPTLAIGPCRAVTFGQSFHRVRRLEVAELVFDLLEPGGSLVLINHVVDGRQPPPNPGHSEIPHAAVRELVFAYRGEDARRALEQWNDGYPARFQDTLAQTRFGATRTVYARGRPDLVRDVDSVVANYFSMSFAAPPLFGDRLAEFESDLRQLLADHAPDGRFWDWPGDTELVIATKKS